MYFLRFYLYGNSVSHTAKLTVKEASTGGDAIPLEIIIISKSVDTSLTVNLTVWVTELPER